jgi:hypothetical protein
LEGTTARGPGRSGSGVQKACAKCAQVEVRLEALFLAGLKPRRSFYTLMDGYDIERGSIPSAAKAARCCVTFGTAEQFAEKVCFSGGRSFSSGIDRAFSLGVLTPEAAFCLFPQAVKPCPDETDGGRV